MQKMRKILEENFPKQLQKTHFGPKTTKQQFTLLQRNAKKQKNAPKLFTLSRCKKIRKFLITIPEKNCGQMDRDTYREYFDGTSLSEPKL